MNNQMPSYTNNNTSNISNDLKIMFWDARSILPKREELSQILVNLDIFVCVETWLSNKNNHFGFPGFKIFRKDRDARGGGILFLLRNNLAFKELSHLNCSTDSVEITGLTITNIEPQVDFY